MVALHRPVQVSLGCTRRLNIDGAQSGGIEGFTISLMKVSLRVSALLVAVVSAPDPSFASPTTSIAEVGTVRLEVDQAATGDRELHLMVHDYAAEQPGLKEVRCKILYVENSGVERLVGHAVLHALQAPSYSGEYLPDFSHGSTLRIVYRSPGQRFSISTWYTLTVPRRRLTRRYSRRRSAPRLSGRVVRQRRSGDEAPGVSSYFWGKCHRTFVHVALCQRETIRESHSQKGRDRFQT